MLINSWYPSMVNQGFPAGACPSSLGACASRQSNRGCHSTPAIIKATLDHCNGRDPSCHGTRFRNAEIDGRAACLSGNWWLRRFLREPRLNGVSGVRKTARLEGPPAQYEQVQLVRFFRALVEMVPQGHAMASRAPWAISGNYRASTAAVGFVGAQARRDAGRKLSGRFMIVTSAGGVAAPRATAAGEKNHNAQQNAYRRLPPGGNARCRHTR